MSYARFSEGDVYIFPHVGGFLTCMNCRLQEVDESGWRGDFETKSRSLMIAHVQEHIAAGHDVPERALARLRDELESEGDLV